MFWERDSQTLKVNLWLPAGRDSWGLWEGHVHTAIFKMDNQQKPILWHMELCSVLCASLDGRGAWGRMDACICMIELLCCLPEIITTLIISYTSIQNKKFRRRKKELQTTLLSIFRLKSAERAQLVKNLTVMWETWVRSLGWEDPLEKGKATHSSILAWRIPWTV